jgi:hypothetical protein
MSRRLVWPTVIILGLAAVLGGESRPLKFDFYGYYNYSWLSPRADSPWNPNQGFNLKTRDSALLLQANGRLLIGKAKLQVSPLLRAAHDGTWEGRLREAALNLNLGAFDLTVGKVLMKLGTGYMFTPISVITPKKQLADPEDTGHEQEGVWMVKADYYRENFSLSALVFKKNNWNNLVLFAYTNVWRLDLYAILYYPEYHQLEFGLAAATTLGESVEIHGEFMMHRRSPVLSHRAFAVPGGNEIFTDWPLFQPADRFYPEALLGTNITVKGVNLIAEYYHADWGISRQDYRRLGGHFASSLALLPEPLAVMNLNADLEFLQSGSRGVMRDYFFIRLWKALKNVNLSALAFVNLADGSFLALAEASLPLADNVALYLRPIYFSGKNGTEYGDSFYASMLQLGLAVSL